MPAPTSHRKRRADVQGLRCLAVLFVLVYHAGLPLPGGFTGVDIFFAISGFVITGTLARRRSTSGSISLPQFYARRVKRLLPALAVMVTTVALVGILASPVSGVRIGEMTGIFAALFTSNGYLYIHTVGSGYFEPASYLNPLLHTWTLGVEEQFYVAFPLVLLIGWRLAARRSRDWLVIAAVAGVSLLSLLVAFRLADKLAFYASPARAWEFGAGALVALLTPVVMRIPPRYARALGVAGAVAIGATGALVQGTSTSAAKAALLPVAGTCALLAAGTVTGTGVARLLSLRPLVWIGDISYSLYLWHWPLIVYAMALWPLSKPAMTAAAATAFVPAWLSYRYVENPVRLNPRIRGRMVLAIAAACIATPIVACLTWFAVVQQLFDSSPALAAVRASQQRSVGQKAECYGAFRVPVARACAWPARRSRGSVVLVGDSIATELTEPFVAAANRVGFDAITATEPGCAFIGLRIRGYFSARETVCRRYHEKSMSELVRARPSLVVIANASELMWDEEITLGPPASGYNTARSAEKERLWLAARSADIRRLNDAGIPVLIPLAPPIASALPSDCAILRVLTDSCTRSRPRDAVDHERRTIMRADRRVVSHAQAAAVVDFIDLLCGDRSCPTTHGRVVLYKDRLHLSVAGALMLTGRFAAVIRGRAARRHATPLAGPASRGGRYWARTSQARSQRGGAVT